MTIRIYVTGGTFDKEYNELKGELFFKNTHLPEMLTLGRSRVSVDIETLMMIEKALRGIVSRQKKTGSSSHTAPTRWLILPALLPGL